ncbi:MAG TPA: DNA polymerase III subunit chi [Chlamydiales bacterium]|nr:DNA polymerase III subunit chi [Chlamydiales bacterium]
MTHSSNTRVVFFQVRDNASKLKRIAEVAHTHFERKEPLLILVDDDRSAQFVDELLWKMPETSFLPHVATDDTTTDWVAIAKAKKNVNSAHIAFNLCPTPLLIEGPFRIIYEFEDLTTPNKKNLSSLRFDAYKSSGYLIEARL